MKQYLIKNRYASVLEPGEIPRLHNFYKLYGTHDPDIRCVHVHENALELGIVMRGSCVSIVDGRSFMLHEGDMLVVNAGVSHEQSFGEDPALVYYSIAIKNLHVRGLRSNALIPDDAFPILREPAYFPSISGLFTLAVDQLDEGGDSSIETANYLMLSALTMMLRLYSAADAPLLKDHPSAAYEQIAHNVCRYIDDHYRYDITLDDMADSISLNKYYMTRAFKRAIGYPPIQYLLRRRIGEAQFLLVETQKSISDIACEVGFSTLGQFSSTFSRILNIAPSRYRIDVLNSYAEEAGLPRQT